MINKDRIKIILLFLLIGNITGEIITVIHSQHKLRDSVTEYTVVDKDYTASYMTTSMIFVNKSPVPINQYHPEEWSISCEGLDARNNIQDFKFYVNEEKYNNTNIGDIIYK